jgi:NAD-dependent deacetylase
MRDIRPQRGRTRAFTSFSHVVRISNGVFAFLGHLDPAPGGRLPLAGFLAAISWADHAPDTSSEKAAVVAQIRGAGWVPSGEPGVEDAFRAGEFSLEVQAARPASGTRAVRVTLTYGRIEASLAQDIARQLRRQSDHLVATHPPPGPPGRSGRLARKPPIIRPAHLARRLQRGPCTVLTGAGLSRASGIRPFTGSGSLCARLAIGECFPGSPLAWMLHRPSELVSLVHAFQASVLAARPNRAHLALAALERRGIVRLILTSNFDELHQAAGSIRVREIATAGNRPLRFPGSVLLTVGVSRDEHGLVAAARAAGKDVIVLGPEVPAFVRESDLYLPGPAEVLLPEVAGMLGTFPARVRDRTG